MPNGGRLVTGIGYERVGQHIRFLGQLEIVID
jgi:hypothetical protein